VLCHLLVLNILHFYVTHFIPRAPSRILYSYWISSRSQDYSHYSLFRPFTKYISFYNKIYNTKVLISINPQSKHNTNGDHEKELNLELLREHYIRDTRKQKKTYIFEIYNKQFFLRWHKNIKKIIKIYPRLNSHVFSNQFSRNRQLHASTQNRC